MPDCTHEWRQQGPLSEGLARYFDDAYSGFSYEGMHTLALRGDDLIRELGGLYPALCALHVCVGDKFRQMQGQVDFPRFAGPVP